MPFGITYMWDLKRNDTNKFMKQRLADLRKENYGCWAGARGEWEKGELGSLGWTCTHCNI